MDNKSNARDIAMAAWQHLAHGHQSGDFTAYLAMLTEDYTFSMPTGAFRGKHVGRSQAAECYAEITKSKPNLTYAPPLRVIEMGDTVVIEFEDEGTIMDRPYRNRIANSFDVRGSHIAGFREYFGDIDPNFIIALSDGVSASPKT